MGVFGSVFNTYASLYQAKDNDLLLAMPIPSGKILLIRLSGVYIMGLLYELIVMIPTLIIWFLRARPGAAGVLFTLLIPLVLSVLVLVLSAVLGWVVALISGRLRRKNLAAVLLSLAFIAAYYYFYAHAYDMLQRLLADPQAVGGRVRGVLYPLYHMGLAAEGNVRSMLLFTAIVGLLFGAVYFVLRRSFLKLATANRGAAKVRYRERPAGGALCGAGAVSEGAAPLSRQRKLYAQLRHGHCDDAGRRWSAAVEAGAGPGGAVCRLCRE